MGNTASQCRPFSLAKFDGRTRKAKFMREVRNTLAEQVGGAPSASQWWLIETAARLSLYLEQLDAKLAGGGALSASEVHSYEAWSGALARTLRDLGARSADARHVGASDGTAEAAA